MARINFVRITQHVAIGVENLHVLSWFAVYFFADFGKSITGLYRIGALRSGRGARLGYRSIGVGIHAYIRGQLLGPVRIYLLNFIPDFILGLLGRSNALQEQLVVLEVNMT